MKRKLIKIIALAIILVFIISANLPIVASKNKPELSLKKSTTTQDLTIQDIPVSCEIIGLPYQTQPKENTLTTENATYLLSLFEKLQQEIVKNPGSSTITQLQQNILDIAHHHNLLPPEITVDSLQAPLQQYLQNKNLHNPLPWPHRGSELFCNYASTGEGSALPIIVLPRLVPILLTPIPRAFFMWDTYNGITSCGGLLSRTGFIAGGSQRGLALGFWGIGFSIFLPPFMSYGILGYALYCRVDAEEMEYWPPNYPPEVNPVFPMDGTINIPIETDELQFYISDPNRDRMSFTVTTDPPVGGGTGTMKTDGTYSVPISGLEGSETYSWTVQVTDGANTIMETYSFTTEQVAPVVSNPTPADGERYISTSLGELRFHLSDLQNDLMDYTVETHPDIGSGSGTLVGNGYYTIEVSGLDFMAEYTWYVNVTDGVYWKHTVFGFQTEPMMVFNPFDYGWMYRKKITIDHTKVAGDLENFPVLISIIDSDLQDKAQPDGDDILFMDDYGVGTRLYHEIEFYNTANGELVTWVNSSVLNSSDDTILYMYYGNPNASSQQIPEKTWDSSYVGIWHLNELSGDILDSSIYTNDGINSGASYNIVGKIGKALDFEANDPDKVKIEHSSSLDITSEITVECWIKPESFPYERSTLCSKRQCYYTNILDTGQLTIYTYWNNGGNRGKSAYMASNTLLTLGSWNHCAWTESSTGYRTIFIDGILDSGRGYEASIWSEPTEDVFLGWQDASPDRTLDGTLDEVRVSNIARSSEWIITGFTNQNNPSAFYSIGPEE